MRFRAFLDANVLVPARERDTLLSLADAGLYDVRWSDGVLEEMTRHLPERMSEAQVEHLLARLADAFPDAVVTSSQATGVDVPARVNAKDRHVVAHALLGRCHVLVTEDSALRAQVEASVGWLDVQSFGVFVSSAIGADPTTAGAALEDMIRNRWLRGVPVDAAEVRSRWAVWAGKRHGPALSAIRW